MHSRGLREAERTGNVPALVCRGTDIMALAGPGTVYSKGRRSCLTSAGFDSVDPCVPVACPESSPSLRSHVEHGGEMTLSSKEPPDEGMEGINLLLFLLPLDFDLALGLHFALSPDVC